MAALVWARQTQGAASVIAPTGASYLGVSGSSSFNGSYLPNNMFNYDVTGVYVGTGLDGDGADWAVAGSVTDAYVAFQLGGGIYSVSSLYFAQRGWWGPGSGGEQMDLAKIWASQTTRLRPQFASGQFTGCDRRAGLVKCSLDRAVAEQHHYRPLFPGRVRANQWVGYAPGGRELRLGGDLSGAVPPEIVENPANRTVCEGGTARLSVVVLGQRPLELSMEKGFRRSKRRPAHLGGYYP